MGNKKILLSLLTVFLVGCVPSLHRLYTDDTVVFHEKLLGSWVQDKEDSVWTFTKGEDKEYDLIIREDEKSGKFKVHLVKLGEMLFMDMYPGELECEEMIDFYKIHILPAHTFMKVKMDESGVELQMMNPDKVSDMLDDNQGLIKHEKLEDGDGMVLTASTKELQEFMVKNAETEKFFGDAMKLEKRRAIFQTTDVIFEFGLTGKWSNEEGTMISSSVGDKYYKIKHTEADGGDGNYTAVLVKTKGMLFWAVFAGDIEGDVLSQPEISPDMVVAIEEVTPKLKLRAMEYDEAATVLKLEGEALKKALGEVKPVEMNPVKLEF